MFICFSIIIITTILMSIFSYIDVKHKSLHFRLKVSLCGYWKCVFLKGHDFCAVYFCTGNVSIQLDFSFICYKFFKQIPSQPTTFLSVYRNISKQLSVHMFTLLSYCSLIVTTLYINTFLWSFSGRWFSIHRQFLQQSSFD